ncbi:hypothetical protein [Fundidesulfovibrio soli]|uniref:hypothetical protein n=1 Tax=Fundidesulfovibrio soli TaxID=2922716 RepID=UPI001FAECAD5|nr:hypothetical protein [Fundidesulfovibrio soli]
MLRCFEQKDAKPPRGKHGKSGGPRQLSLWGATARSASKTARALEEHSLREVAVLWTPAAKKLDLPAVQELEARCRALADSVTSGAAATHGAIRNAGLTHPSDVAAYLTLRELDDKGRSEVPQHRLQVIDFGVKALVGR